MRARTATPARAFGALLVLLTLGSSASATVILPYENDFSTEVGDFTEVADGDWTLDPGSGVYTFYRTGTAAAYDRGTTVEVPALGGSHERDFTITTRLQMLQVRGGFGLVALSDSSVLSSSHYYRALVSLVSGGFTVSIEERGGGTLNTYTTLFQPMGGLAVLTLEGTYLTDGSLRLDFTFDRQPYGGFGAATLTRTLIDPTPATGQHFGLFAWKQGSSFASLMAEADFDYLTLSVPEPSTGALLALGLLGLRLGRRRRS